MFEDFDELFNSLFNQRKRNNLDSLNEFINKLRNDNMENPDNGEPTSKRTYVKNGFTFEETTWENEFGKMVKVELIDTPLNRPKVKEISLEEKLELAIKEERYEDAAKLRDAIKNNTNQTADNEFISKQDEWNF